MYGAQTIMKSIKKLMIPMVLFPDLFFYFFYKYGYSSLFHYKICYEQYK